MRRYLLDTNHMSYAIRRVSAPRDRIRQRHRAGDTFGTCVPVLCELEVGIRQTEDIEGYHRRLEGVLEMVRIWPLDLPTVPLYAQYWELLRARGRVLGPVDLLLAALATQMGAVLLTSDLDFTGLPEVPTENWLT